MAISNRPLLDANGLVVNVIVHDDALPAEAQPILPDGHTLGPEGGKIGDTWNGSAYVTPPPAPPPPPPAAVPLTKDQLAAYAANKRYQAMVAGVTVNGLTVPGDDTSQNRLKQASDGIAAGTLAEPLDFVVGLVSVQLTKSQIDAIRAALLLETQAAFAMQATAVAAINAGTITTTDQINLLNWPN